MGQASEAPDAKVSTSGNKNPDGMVGDVNAFLSEHEDYPVRCLPISHERLRVSMARGAFRGVNTREGCFNWYRY